MSIALTDTSVVTDVNLEHEQRPHGLLSVTATLDGGTPQWIYGGTDIEIVCGGIGTTTAFCLGAGTPPVDKVPFSNEWPHLSPLAVYAIHECKSIGKEWGTREEDARTALMIGEQTALEEFFFDLASTDAVAATATSTVEAFLAAEDLAGYDSGRVIHLTPSNALRLAEYLNVVDGALVTKIGTPVVVGLGYVTGLGNDVLVTGTPLAALGEMFVTETVVERTTNLVSVLAEKPYALGFACGATLITVTP